MSDPNLADFYRRVARIERTHTQGMGFESAGTLGRSYYLRGQRRRRSFLMPLLFVALAAVALKAVIYQQTGASTYQLRVDRLLAGEGINHVGGWLMQVDPVTEFLSSKLAAVLVMVKS